MFFRHFSKEIEEPGEEMEKNEVNEIFIEEEGEESDDECEPPPPPKIDPLKVIGHIRRPLTPSTPTEDDLFLMKNRKPEPVIVKKLKEPDNIENFLTIVHLSDTHSSQDAFYVPKGDVFIYSGDFTNYRDWCIDRSTNTVKKIPDSVAEFNNFLGKLPHKFKFVICGNHDYLNYFTPKYVQEKILTNCIYLQDSSFTIDIKRDFPEKEFSKKFRSVTFYGSPWTIHPMAFGFRPLKTKWDLIPNNTNVLITHTPPNNIMDLAFTMRKDNMKKVCDVCSRSHPYYSHWGCVYLKKRIEVLNEIGNLKVHCFGHVHDCFGIQVDDNGMIYMNGCNKRMKFRPPLVYYYKLTN